MSYIYVDDSALNLVKFVQANFKENFIGLKNANS